MASCFVSVGAGKKTDGENNQDLVRQWLGHIQGSEGGRIIPLMDEAISRAFPGYSFYVVRYPQFPIARALPETLKYNNLVVIPPRGNVEALPDRSALEAFFQKVLTSIGDETRGKIVVRAWLLLTQELHQDGFFQFEIPRDSLVATREKTGWVISGRALVVPDTGNKGEIAATLQFDSAGKLVKVEETVKVVAGSRPI